MYNRSIYAHKVFYEAIQCLLLKLFFTWLHEHGLSNEFGDETIQHNIHFNLCPESFESSIDGEEFECYYTEYQRFVNDLKCENNPLATFWLSYIDLVSLVLDVIYSTRVGDWNVFIESVKDVTVWAFAYDRYNYSRYLLVFLRDTLKLPLSHPDVYDAFIDGNFSVQLSENNTFGRNEADKTIENTVNKDTKTSGGLTGFSLKQSASDRWMINSSRRAECYRNLKELVSFSAGKYIHHDLTPSRIKKDEGNVQAILSVFETTFSDPFNGFDLIGLSSGKKATIDMQENLLQAWQKGKFAMDEFKLNRLSENRTVPFFDQIKKLKLKTFSDLTASKKVKSNGKEVIIKSDKELLGRMAVIAKDRLLDPK